MSASNINYYSDNAQAFSDQYEALKFEDVHCDWLSHLPVKGLALDVGAGSGRDAAYLAEKGLNVVAVEPAEKLRNLACLKYRQLNIDWLDDTLPELQRVFALQFKFDLILLSAVWMHILPVQRERAFLNLCSLLAPNGKLIISLRYGACTDERTMYKVSSTEIEQYAKKSGFSFYLTSPEITEDKMGRNDVAWQTVVIKSND